MEAFAFAQMGFHNHVGNRSWLLVAPTVKPTANCSSLAQTLLLQALMMDAGTLSADIKSDLKSWNRARWFTETTVHLTSLLHGMALQHLRSDRDLANLTAYRPLDPQPPLVLTFRLPL